MLFRNLENTPDIFGTFIHGRVLFFSFCLRDFLDKRPVYFVTAKKKKKKKNKRSSCKRVRGHTHTNAIFHLHTCPLEWNSQTGNEEDAQKYRESTRDRLLWWLRNVGNLALYNSIDRARFDHSSDLAILIFSKLIIQNTIDTIKKIEKNVLQYIF